MCFNLQINQDWGVKQLEIKSAVVDWAFMPWKLNPRSWICFKLLKQCFFEQIWKKDAVRKEKTAYDLKINRWKKYSTTRIGFLGHKWRRLWQQKENNVFSNIFPAVSTIFMPFICNPRPWKNFEKEMSIGYQMLFIPINTGSIYYTGSWKLPKGILVTL